MMTRQEAAIVTAYTGFLIGSFSDMHELAEKVMGVPMMTHEFGDRELMKELKEKVKPLFVGIEITDNANKAESALAEVVEPAGRIRDWCGAYPLDVFPEPDFKLARKGLKSVGITMDQVSASNMRHVLNGITEYSDQLQAILEKHDE
jgi:hypothetical protein